ncbi:hypothetical protein BJ741DRAFT_621802 [Chytriomyces cf. hyalinus JEL632]|nr:hypothetical protein BJ741DRAFT_621802 [Chytriomyces cf. hyalinus JEL632]
MSSKCSSEDAAYTAAASASTAPDQCDQTVMNALHADFTCSRSAFKSINPNYDSPNTMLRFCKNSRSILLHDPGTATCVDQQAAYASVYAQYPANDGCDQRVMQALYDYYRCNIYEFVSLSSNYDAANSMLRYCRSIGINVVDPASGGASPTAAPDPPIASTLPDPQVSANVPVDPGNSQAVPIPTSQSGAASNGSPNNPAPVTSIPGGGGGGGAVVVGNPGNPTNKSTTTTSSIPTATNTSNSPSNSDNGTPMSLILGASLGGIAVLAIMIGVGVILFRRSAKLRESRINTGPWIEMDRQDFSNVPSEQGSRIVEPPRYSMLQNGPRRPASTIRILDDPKLHRPNLLDTAYAGNASRTQQEQRQHQQRDKSDSWRVTPTEAWTVDQVAAWAAFELRDVEQQFLDQIRVHRIDGRVLLELTREQIRDEFGLVLGQAVLFEGAIRRLNK